MDYAVDSRVEVVGVVVANERIFRSQFIEAVQPSWVQARTQVEGSGVAVGRKSG